ncbi:PREDICTED: midkine isoform X1 [Colobus angolensis palliatus]|nr:PREDICTED: midkine isoform X1 [Colobus angolensis palliatus]
MSQARGQRGWAVGAAAVARSGTSQTAPVSAKFHQIQVCGLLPQDPHSPSLMPVLPERHWVTAPVTFSGGPSPRLPSAQQSASLPTRGNGPRMQHRGFLLLTLLALLALTSAVAKKKDKVKKGGPGSECAEWAWGPCTPSSKDCGVGFREGTCGAQTQRIRCRVPCNWKKEFGADCKYKFENWGACDGGTGTKVRQGTLKKARYNAQCQETIRVTKPCTPKTKAKAKGQREEKGVGLSQGVCSPPPPAACEGTIPG